MPIYEFECTACGHVFDRLQKLSDPDPSACPDCTDASVRRRLTAPAFRLAGSGWYETDFKSDEEKKRNLAGAQTGEAKSDAKTDAKPDTKKPDAKSDAKPKSEPAPKPAATADAS